MLVAFLVGGLLTYSIGVTSGVNACVSFGVDKVFKIMNDNNLTEDLKEAVKIDLWKYKNNIGGC